MSTSEAGSAGSGYWLISLGRGLIVAPFGERQPDQRDIGGHENMAVWSRHLDLLKAPLAWLRGSAAVLLYHRVSDAIPDPHCLSVSPLNFEEQLRVLVKSYNVLTLDEMVRALRSGNVPRKAVTLTFDDGYADNLLHAKPLLEKYAVPATVFVTSGHVGKTTEFWWDEEATLLLAPPKLPATLTLKIKDITHSWHLGKSAEVPPSDLHLLSEWNMLSKHDTLERFSVLREIHKVLGSLNLEDRKAALDTLRTQMGKPPENRQPHRTLDWDEVVSLATGGLVTIGAHTITHPALSRLPSEAQRLEIGSSKTQLEDMLGKPVRCFSYPFGSPSDYTARTVSIVRELGFESACSNYRGTVTPTTDPYQVPRFMVMNWNGDEFSRRLAWFFVRQ